MALWYYAANLQRHFVASTTGPSVEPDQMVSPFDEKTTSCGRRPHRLLMHLDLYKFGDAATLLRRADANMLAGTYRVWESLSGGLPNTSWYVNPART